MLVDLLNRLLGLNEPTLIATADKRKERWLLPDGEIKEVELPLAPRAHTLFDADSLAGMLERLVDPGAAEVFIRSDSATVMLDAKDRTETAVLKFRPTPAFDWLYRMACARDQPYSLSAEPRAVREHLVRMFGLSEDEPIMKALARVDFKRIEEQRMASSRTGDTLGSEVEETVQSASSFPEIVSLRFQPFGSLFSSHSATVEVSTFLNVREGKVELFMTSNQSADFLWTVTKAARHKIAMTLDNTLGAGHGVTIFLGEK